MSGGGRVSDNGVVSGAGEPAEAAKAGLVARAVDGDKAALEEVIRLLSDPLYRLALRMSWRPADAEDATQEILIRVVTRLASWRGEARLLTWAYRIGVNYLLNLRRKTPQEAQQLSLDDFGATLADGLADADYRGPEAAVLAQEVRLSCTQAMLQCLERGERIAFVLSDVFELSSADAAWILETTPGRVPQAAGAGAAPHRRVHELHLRRGQPRRVLPLRPAGAEGARRRPDRSAQAGLTAHPVTPSGRGVAEAAAQLHRLHDAAAVMRAHPDYAAPRRRSTRSRRCCIPDGSRCWNKSIIQHRYIERTGLTPRPAHDRSQRLDRPVGPRPGALHPARPPVRVDDRDRRRVPGSGQSGTRSQSGGPLNGPVTILPADSVIRTDSGPGGRPHQLAEKTTRSAAIQGAGRQHDRG